MSNVNLQETSNKQSITKCNDLNYDYVCEPHANDKMQCGHSPIYERDEEWQLRYTLDSEGLNALVHAEQKVVQLKQRYLECVNNDMSIWDKKLKLKPILLFTYF